VIVWQAKDWEQQAAFGAPFTDIARAIAFTADSKNLVAASDKYIRDVKGGSPWDGNVVFIWTVPASGTVGTIHFDDFHGVADNRGAGFVTSMAISPDGELVGLGRLGSVSVVLHKKSGRLAYDLPNNGQEHSLTFSPDGKTLISALKGAIVQSYDAANGKKLGSFDLNGEEAICVRSSPDGKQIAVGVSDGSVRLLAADLSKQLRSLEVSTDKERVQALAYPAKADLLAAATTTKVRLFEASSGKQLQEWGKDELRVSCIALSPDGKLLAVGYGGEHNVKGDFRGGYVNIWDTATGRLVKKLD
jgi:WD40 repeat protein